MTIFYGIAAGIMGSAFYARMTMDQIGDGDASWHLLCIGWGIMMLTAALSLAHHIGKESK